ncbi:MAG: hypothetical protein K0R26_841 [Bacteroidota bacterium]|nr:hypothetical protein [Bacteroidota bacterium]
MDTTINSMNFQQNITLNDQIQKHLIETAKWAKFLAILGFIGIGLMVLGAFSVLVVGVSFGTLMGNDSFGIVGAVAIALLYLVIALVYFFPCYYLFKTSIGFQNGIRANNQDQLTAGFANLKSHYKFLGIMMIVIISLNILIMVFAVIALSFRL